MGGRGGSRDSVFLSHAASCPDSASWDGLHLSRRVKGNELNPGLQGERGAETCHSLCHLCACSFTPQFPHPYNDGVLLGCSDGGLMAATFLLPAALCNKAQDCAAQRLFFLSPLPLLLFPISFPKLKGTPGPAASRFPRYPWDRGHPPAVGTCPHVPSWEKRNTKNLKSGWCQHHAAKCAAIHPCGTCRDRGALLGGGGIRTPPQPRRVQGKQAGGSLRSPTALPLFPVCSLDNPPLSSVPPRALALHGEGGTLLAGTPRLPCAYREEMGAAGSVGGAWVWECFQHSERLRNSVHNSRGGGELCLLSAPQPQPRFHKHSTMAAQIENPQHCGSGEPISSLLVCSHWHHAASPRISISLGCRFPTTPHCCSFSATTNCFSLFPFITLKSPLSAPQVCWSAVPAASSGHPLPHWLPLGSASLELRCSVAVGTKPSLALSSSLRPTSPKTTRTTSISLMCK